MPRFYLAATAAVALFATAASSEVLISDGKIVVANVSRDTFLVLEPVEFPRGIDGITVRIVGQETQGKREPLAYDVLVETGNELPPIDLTKFGDLVDGLYKFEVTGTTGEKIEKPDSEKKLDDGRDEFRDFDLATFTLSGVLLVDGGKIITFEQMTEKGSEISKPGEEIDDGDEGRPKGKPNEGRDETIDDSDKGEKG